MTLDTLLRYALRLWLAGALHLGGFLLRAGPYGLAAAGFAGWLATHAEPRQRPGPAPESPAFTLR